LLSESLIKNKEVEDALKIEKDDILLSLDGLPKDNLHCAVLAVNTLHAAIDDYKNKREMTK